MKTDPTVILRRKITNRVMVALFSLAVLISIGALAAILWKLSVAGLKAFSIDIFTKGTPAPGTAGGLLNAIVGSIVLVVTGLAGAIPLGVLAGTYLAEYGRRFLDGKRGPVLHRHPFERPFDHHRPLYLRNNRASIGTFFCVGWRRGTVPCRGPGDRPDHRRHAIVLSRIPCARPRSLWGVRIGK